MVQDIFGKNEQREIVVTEHNRAHRAANCRVCAKYIRHNKQEMCQTPLPFYVGEMLHIDVSSTDIKYFLTRIDKFSKFAIVQTIPSLTIIDLLRQ